MTTLTIAFTLNGVPTSVEIDPADRLLDTLRYALALTGTKEGCGEGECGACTVYRRVETVESLDPRALAPFGRAGATQCGACTPGVVMTAMWLRAHRELLATHTIRELMAGNLCRCTGYDGIVDSIRDVLAEGDGEGDGDGDGKREADRA